MLRPVYHLLPYIALGVITLQVIGVDREAFYAEPIEESESSIEDFERLEGGETESTWVYVEDVFAPNVSFVERRSLLGFAAKAPGEHWKPLWSRPPPRV